MARPAVVELRVLDMQPGIGAAARFRDLDAVGAIARTVQKEVRSPPL
jgi:hypothetical protein